MLDELKDPTMILFMVAALVSIILGVALPEERRGLGYLDGIAILVAVVGAGVC